jgi:SmpA / OmlA family
MRNRYFVMVLVGFIFSGCATGTNFKSVRQGMTKEEVMSIMGDPDDARKNSDYTSYKYLDRKTDDWSWNKADYFILFDSDGKVQDYGRENFQDYSASRSRSLSNTLSTMGNAFQSPVYQPAAPVYVQPTPTQINCTSKNLFGTVYTDCSGY